jgi:hypothetical protein
MSDGMEAIRTCFGDEECWQQSTRDDLTRHQRSCDWLHKRVPEWVTAIGSCDSFHRAFGKQSIDFEGILTMSPDNSPAV